MRVLTETHKSTAGREIAPRVCERSGASAGIRRERDDGAVKGSAISSDKRGKTCTHLIDTTAFPLRIALTAVQLRLQIEYAVYGGSGVPAWALKRVLGP